MKISEIADQIELFQRFLEGEDLALRGATKVDLTPFYSRDSYFSCRMSVLLNYIENYDTGEMERFSEKTDEEYIERWVKSDERHRGNSEKFYHWGDNVSLKRYKSAVQLLQIRKETRKAVQRQA